MTGSVCCSCGHAWRGHRGASVWIYACIECAYEADYDARDETDVCWLVPPGTDQMSAADSLVARYERRRLRGDRVSIEDHLGQRWALLRPPVAVREETERLLHQVQEDLASMSILQFREKYRARNT